MLLKPPVNIIFGLTPISNIIFSIIESIIEAWPIINPLCIASYVFLPITFFGRSSSTDFKEAVLEVSASKLILIPGAIEPPRYSLFLFTMSNVVAVPRSITITLSEVFIKPATELAILSGPSSVSYTHLTLPTNREV